MHSPGSMRMPSQAATDRAQGPIPSERLHHFRPLPRPLHPPCQSGKPSGAERAAPPIQAARSSRRGSPPSAASSPRTRRAVQQTQRAPRAEPPRSNPQHRAACQTRTVRSGRERVRRWRSNWAPADQPQHHTQARTTGACAARKEKAPSTPPVHARQARVRRKRTGHDSRGRSSTQAFSPRALTPW